MLTAPEDTFARLMCWLAGNLLWLLDENQRGMYAAWKRHTARRFVLECGRRVGKTFMLVVIACMTCLRKPGCRVVYCAPTLLHLKEFVLPAFDKIAATCPESIRPRFNSSNSHIEFHNGAWIHLFGADDKRKADRGTGGDAELAIVDEAGADGLAQLLVYIVKSILGPSLLMTNGRILVASSPARGPEHEFTAMTEQAEAVGAHVRRTIYDNPRLTPAQVDAYIETDAKDEGLTAAQYIATDTFRREYLAERVVDKLLVVLPEWADARKTCLVAVEKPPFYDALTWLDFGGADPHAVHFAYYHFKLAKVVIEDELLLREGQNTAELATAIKRKETDLWGVTKWAGTQRAYDDTESGAWAACYDDLKKRYDESCPTQPYVRWADNDRQLIIDLQQLHDLAFCPTRKDDAELQVNNLRVLIQRGEVLVHPRCVNTDRHWRNTQWQNHKRLDFARVANEHGDLISTAKYGCRNLYKRNPYPPGWQDVPLVDSAGAPLPMRPRRVEPKKSLLGNSPLAKKLTH